MHTHGRTLKTAARTLVLLGLAACSGYEAPTDPGVTTPPPAPVLLKEVLIDRLPSPFYHFDYDPTGRISGLSYASGLDNYLVRYLGERIRQIDNTGPSSLARIAYAYDPDGHVGGVRYVDAAGMNIGFVIFTYENGQLTGVERSRRLGEVMVIDKTTTLAYYPDGNLETITEHRPAVAGFQNEVTNVIRYEQYDGGTNVDGFSLIHDDFFDHLVLLPGVVLQKNNPRLETRTGDGLTYTVSYTYDYGPDGKHPLAKRGDLLITGGGTVGQRIQIGSTFTYY